MAATLRCYHHSNCEDHPAVATCTSCGKGLCRECADNLRSPNTGKVLCVDCRNAELEKEVAWANRMKAQSRSELIKILVGLSIGIILQIVLGALYGSGVGGETMEVIFYLSFVLFMPTLFASFGTIIGILSDRAVIVKIILFPILCIASPIMFIVRVVKRVKKMKAMRRHAAALRFAQDVNDEYAREASEMKTRLTTAEFENEMRLKYAELALTNKSEYDKMLREENAKRDLELQEEKAKNEKLSRDLKMSMEELDQAKKDYEAADKKSKKSEKRAKAQGRKDDEIAA